MSKIICLFDDFINICFSYLSIVPTALFNQYFQHHAINRYESYSYSTT